MNESAPLKRRRGRPPKNLSGHNETRSQLIHTGIEILAEKGFSATGIDEILKSIGVPKGSFYHYFESKDRFGLELIDSYSRALKGKLNRFLLDDTLQPLDRLKAYMTDAEKSMEKYDFKRGCLIGNLGQEMGRLPENFRERLTSVLEDWQGSVERCLEEAKVHGQVSSDLDCKQLAYIFWTGWEGAVLRAKLERSAKPLKAFSDFYLSSL
ncbi:acrylate utilization transcriptional regulator AcuR [Porticoccus sp.]